MLESELNNVLRRIAGKVPTPTSIALMVNNTVTSIGLSRNRIGAEGEQAILNAYTENKRMLAEINGLSEGITQQINNIREERIETIKRGIIQQRMTGLYVLAKWGKIRLPQDILNEIFGYISSSTKKSWGNTTLLKITPDDISFFNQNIMPNIEDESLVKNRHDDSIQQHEYDKRFGLLVLK